MLHCHRPLRHMIFQIVLLLILFARQESAIHSLCVSGSNLSLQVNGRYEYLYWDSKANASIYYSSEISKYLYPILHSQSKQYIITKNRNDTNIHNATSTCLLDTSSAIEYYKQCFKHWISMIDNESFSDSNMRLFDCTDICVTDNYYWWLEGTYLWHSFNTTRQTAVYHCPTCWYNRGTYLFAWPTSSSMITYYWKISNFIGVSSWSYCFFYMSLNGANVGECAFWYTWTGTEWIYEALMRAGRCIHDPYSTEATHIQLEAHDKVCVTGSFLSSLKGEYLYLNNSTYYNAETRGYLYRLNSTLAADGYGITQMNKTLKAYCVNDCLDHWLVYINGSWITNPRMRLVDCNEICVKGDNRTWLNGAYFWSHFNYSTNSSVYHCSECTQYADNGTYLYGWVFPNHMYEWRIGSDFSASNAWTSCPLGYNLASHHLFDIEDCQQWDTWNAVSFQWISQTSFVAEQCHIGVTDEPTLEPTYNPTEPAALRHQGIYDDCYIYNSIHTDWYGASIEDDSTGDAINKGRIAGILSWGLTVSDESNLTYHAISNLQFVHTNQTEYDQAVNVSNERCSAFVLQHDDYINGYRVIYTHRAIHGLVFHTMKGNTYRCVADIFLQSYNDTGDVYFNNSYLSGLNTHSSDVIDSISLQFTSFSECHFIVFGFEIPYSGDLAQWSSDSVTMTLYWNSLRYQCSVRPRWLNRYYSCNTLDTMTTLQCDANTFANPIEYGLQIDAFVDSHAGYYDDFEVERVVIKYVTNDKIRNLYIFEYFCFNQCNEAQDTFTVDNTWTDHDPHRPYLNNLVAFNHTTLSSFSDTTALTADVFNQTVSAQCLPDGYSSACISKGNGTAKHCPYEDKYILVPLSKTWEEAEAFCEEKYNSNLATLITKEDLLIAGTISRANRTIDELWIGLFRLESALDETWTWVGDTDCDYCLDDDQWKSDLSSRRCAVLEPGFVHGLFSAERCTRTNHFLCNNPMYYLPTVAPTQSPTHNPTNIVISENIIIINHENITANWIAFGITNINTECGGSIVSVKISDSFPYEDVWINYTSKNTNGYYTFDHFSEPFTVPISVQITKAFDDGSKDTIIGSNIITSLQGGKQFDFESNFCETTEEKSSSQILIDYTFYISVLCIIAVFCVIGLVALLDAKSEYHRNDYFHISALCASLIQILDMWSDIFFIIEVHNTMENRSDLNIQFLIIFILSIVFVLVPVGISLYQLYASSSKHWLEDNRIREWLRSYSKLLYLLSVLTGSSFAAIELCNSNMFNLDVFYMGLSRNHLLSYSTKKLYSIVLWENAPQVILSCWYTLLLGQLNYIPAAQMVFSLISIVVTVITMILQKRINVTQEYVHITMDVTGKCVMDNLKICTRKIKDIKSFLSQTVLGVNDKFVDIQKPFNCIRNGLQLQTHISYNLDMRQKQTNIQSSVSVEDYYEALLKSAIADGSLVEVIKKTWTLSAPPVVENVCCVYHKSKISKETNIPTNDEDIGLMEQWKNVTKQASISTATAYGEETELIKYKSTPL